VPEPREDSLAEPFLAFLNVAESFLVHEQDRVRSR
jgi:hypothetical protein